VDIVEEEEVEDPPPCPSHKGRGVDSNLSAKIIEKNLYGEIFRYK
jgi:hypothetical protein